MKTLLTYQDYRVVQSDHLNLKLEFYTDVVDKTTKKPKKEFVLIGYFSNVKQALKRIVSHMGFDVPSLQAYINKIEHLEDKIDEI